MWVVKGDRAKEDTAKLPCECRLSRGAKRDRAKEDRAQGDRAEGDSAQRKTEQKKTEHKSLSLFKNSFF